MHPEICVPLAENATAPDGATELVETVAVRVTDWLVLAGAGFGVANDVVVATDPGWTVTAVADEDDPVKFPSPA